MSQEKNTNVDAMGLVGFAPSQKIRMTCMQWSLDCGGNVSHMHSASRRPRDQPFRLYWSLFVCIINRCIGNCKGELFCLVKTSVSGREGLSTAVQKRGCSAVPL